MNNLKRVLSLGLSGVMLAGLLTVGASAADFTDAADIQHADAVNILSALKVIDGKPDGSFAPEETVTRSQMAKMIAVAMNGGNDTFTGVKTTPSFKDIKGHWAEAYIEYCADLDIISGRGDGTFDPDATVTGIEATKMVLTALGYNAEAYQLVGAKWATRTDQLAQAAQPVSLYDQLAGTAMNAPASRDTAAQLIWNGLQDRTVKVTPDTSLSTGEITWQYVTNNTKTLLAERYGGQIWIGKFEGNKNITGVTADKGEISVYGKIQDSTNNAASAHFPSDFDIANIGEEVKVIFKDGTNGTPNKPDKKDTIYGVFNTGATTVVNVTRADVSELKSTKQNVKLDGTEYEVANSVTVYTNYASSHTYTSDDKIDGSAVAGGNVLTGTTGTGGVASALTLALRGSGANGDTIKAVADSNGKLATFYVTTYKIAAITAMNNSKITLNNGVGTFDIEDNEIYEGAKKGDVVVVSTLYKANAYDDDAYNIVEKAEVVSGEVKGWKGTESIDLDGTSYDIYDETAMLSAIPSETTTTTMNDDCIGEEFDLYLVKGFVGAAVQISESANNYSVVTEVKGTSNTGSVFQGLQLQVMDAEGTKTIITTNSDSKQVDGTKLDADSQIGIGDIVVWSGTAGDATVTVKAKFDNATVMSYDQKTKALDGAVAADNCVLFAEVSGESWTAGDNFKADTSFKAYKLRDLKDQLSKPTIMVKNSDGKVVAAFMKLTEKPGGATSNTVYGIVSTDAVRMKVGSTSYNYYKVVNDQETYDVYTNDNLSKGTLVAFDPTTDNTYASGAVAAPSNSTVVYVDGLNEKDNTLTYFTKKTGPAGAYVGLESTRNTLALDDDCAIVYVDKDGKKAGTAIGVDSFDSVTGYANAMIVTENQGGKNVIIAIYVETSNKANIGTITKANYQVGLMGIANGSSNINLAIYDSDNNNWLSADEIKALNLTNSMFTITGTRTGGTNALADLALADGTDSKYPWSGALAVIGDEEAAAASVTAYLNTFRGNTDADAGFIKLHTNKTFATSDTVVITLASFGDITVTMESGGSQTVAAS